MAYELSIRQSIAFSSAVVVRRQQRLTVPCLSMYVDAMKVTNVPSPKDPAAALAAVLALRRLADRLENAAVAQAIAAGWTWAEVAEALGVTRQAAHKKHAQKLRDLS